MEALSSKHIPLFYVFNVPQMLTTANIITAFFENKQTNKKVKDILNSTI